MYFNSILCEKQIGYSVQKEVTRLRILSWNKWQGGQSQEFAKETRSEFEEFSRLSINNNISMSHS